MKTPTYPTTSASPGRVYNESPFNPLPSVPSPFRLALTMMATDALKVAAGFLIVTGVGGLLLLSAAIASHNLPAAIAMVLVTCFGSGFAGYAITKARSFA